MLQDTLYPLNDICTDFFTNAEAIADYKNRLRYLVARYAYSTSVFAWEFFNEVYKEPQIDYMVWLLFLSLNPG